MKIEEITKLSIFSGILGDDLASEWAGIKTVCCVEIDPFCQAVIKKHYPDMPIIGDIHDVTKEKVKEVSGVEWVDIIAGGDPCQPRSIAGKRRGREDDRDLWKDMFRVVCEFKPTWVVNENPTGRLSMDFHQVLSDLESQGYETRSFVISACAVNANHRRDRLYIVAYNNHSGNSTSRGGFVKDGKENIKQGNDPQFEYNRQNSTSSHSDSRRQQQPQGSIKDGGRWIANSSRPNVTNTTSKRFKEYGQSGTLQSSNAMSICQWSESR